MSGFGPTYYPNVMAFTSLGFKNLLFLLNSVLFLRHSTQTKENFHYVTKLKNDLRKFHLQKQFQ